MDRMKPLRYLDLHNLTTMLSKPKLDLQFLYHVIDSSKACIIDNISQLHNNEVWDEVCYYIYHYYFYVLEIYKINSYPSYSYIFVL